MKCLQCGADLLDSATFCARCGTPVRATSFSYLPAGTPPWPTVVPQKTSLATGTAITTTPVTHASSVVSEPSPGSRRSVGGIFAGCFLLILAIVVGVGGTLGFLALNGYSLGFGSTGTTPSRTVHIPTPVPTTTSSAGTPGVTPTATGTGNQLPTPTSFQIAKFTQVGVSLKYPADWVQDKPQSDANSTSIGLHPQQQLGVYFIIQRFSAAGSTQFKTLDDLNQSVLASFSQDPNLHDFKTIQPANATPTISGVQWAEQDATFANAQNVVLHFVTASVKHNNVYYNIGYFAPDFVYNEAMQKYFSQMLTSFQFTS